MKTAIVTIGDEILIGQIVDTNSAWIANKLTSAGFEVEEMASIGDNASQIKDTLDDIFQRVDVILTTGGLGPTKDDITKNTLCDYFHTTLVFSDEVLKNIENIIVNPNALNELTRNQAYVPKDAIIIQNKFGTAPVTWFERDGKVLISMPGVPHEMRHVLEEDILPRLQHKYETESYVSRTLLIRGYAESALAIYLTDFENNLPEGFGLAYLPSLGMIRLRLFVRGEERRQGLNEQVAKLEKLLGDSIVAENDEPVEKLLGMRLFEKGLTISTAESCTGGNIAHMITANPGASTNYYGSVVSYDNEVKKNVLKVSAENLEKYGAVSEQVAIEMVQGVCRLMNTDCGIATTGIAGPDGGTPEKPVGTVWIATACKGKVIANIYHTGNFREVNIMRASNLGIIQLLGMLDEC